MKRFIGLSLVLFSTLFYSGCSNSASTPNVSGGAENTSTSGDASKELKNIRVQLAFLMQSLDAPLVVAIDKGYFKEEGLNVSFERGFGNSDTISKLGTGKFDLAFSDMYNTLEFNSKNPAEKIKAVAIVHSRAPFSIVTFKDKGISSPKDLAGKKLGAPAGDGPRKLFPLLAKEAGIDPNSINWTTMEPKLRETFLLQGQVDAVSGFSTSIIPSLLKGGKKMDDLSVFYYNESGLDFYGNAILAKSDFIDKNPAVVKSFVKAYLRGVQDVIKDPNAGLEALMAADQSKLMDREAEKVRLQIALERLIITPEAETLGLGAVDQARLQKSIDQTVAGFKISGNPKSADIFTDQFLPPKSERTLPPAAERKPLI
ncbi:MAG: ABC transporter substrate-binding protein [Thermosynechococcaceae cyanobacterium MS004]|nr:ABC transporter substrate-binding protein [Thermosynechococcaceae cyanobacterium MS004]